MHNFYFGSAKRMVEMWTEHYLVRKEYFVRIDNMIQSFNMSADCGRLPLNFSSSYGEFTAFHCIMVYSPVVLKDVLPQDHLLVLFVRTCVLMSKWFVSDGEIDTADLFLLQFCRRL